MMWLTIEKCSSATDAVNQHKKFFGGDDDGKPADSSGVGAAAAMQALKMFSGGQASGSSQGQFMALAMSEASKVGTPAPWQWA